ncbi:MAG TPA: hypothetical protein VF644_11020 [Pyrinomonadaceae bacterium]
MIKNMIDEESFDKLRLEISVKAKNGLDFILSAAVTWLVISFIWTLPYSSYNKSVLTLISSSILLPLALLLSKVLKTSWTIQSNPLQPLGLWLNFAQLFYFPILIFLLLKMPDYFVMGLAIITGAHFLPYAWFYKTNSYAIIAGIISLGAVLISLNITTEKMYIVPLFTSFSLMILAILLYFSYKKAKRQ